jgi:molybdenum cofactor cytidylyltransferase
MISAIVLAAGASARFGQSKQLMRLGDKTILEHVLDVVAQTKIDHVVVVLGANAAEIRRHIAFAKQRVIVNEDHLKGMSTSIHAGLRTLTAQSDAAMFVLGDQPLVKPQTLDTLIDEYLRTKAPIVIPTYRGARGNPVIIDRSVFPRVMDLRGDVGFRSLFTDYSGALAKVEVDDVGIVTDIDTQDDLDEITGH